MGVMDMTVLIVAAFAVAGCIGLLLSVRGRMRLTAELQQRTEQQLQQLASTVRTLETRVAEMGKVDPAAPRVGFAPAPAAVPVAAAVPAVKKEEEISPELLVVMAAAVTVFLGKKVRIRSAKMLQSPYEIVNPWSQQGRVFVQASHNLRSR
jgi:methylmalonyl-CoA carboxyltransferase large subunit